MQIILLFAVIAAVVIIFNRKKKKPAKATSGAGKGKKSRNRRTTTQRSHVTKSGGGGGSKTDKHFNRHFRKFHSKETTGHPSYIYGEDGKDYKIVKLTTSPTTNNISNIPLDKNPEPGNEKQSYIQPNPGRINKGIRNEKLNGWKFTNEDKKKVQAVIDKDKK